MPKIITSDELQRWMKVGREFVLLDVLTNESYKEKHLPHALHVSAQEQQFDRKVEDLINSKDATIVIYGDRGREDALYIAGIKLSHAGYDDVYEFKGGMREWVAQGLPLEDLATQFCNEHPTFCK